jgi:hypothetical protein
MSTPKISIRCVALSLAVSVMNGLCAHGQQPSAQEECLPSSKPSVQKSAHEVPVRPIHRVKHPPKASVDWTTMPSTYSHDQQGQRVDQYALAVEPLSPERTDIVRSGYRHSRSTLQTGFSADHYHTTEQWGGPVQPYGEWRYPNRPFSVPYGQWGPQLPQVIGGGFPIVGPGFNNAGPNMQVHPNNQLPPGAGMGQPNLGPNHPHNHPHNNGWNGQWNQNVAPANGLQVGPWNTLPATQDEYYQQAPSLRTPGSNPWRGYFQSPDSDN